MCMKWTNDFLKKHRIVRYSGALVGGNAEGNAPMPFGGTDGEVGECEDIQVNPPCPSQATETSFSMKTGAIHR